jgi:hypothetical protein
VAFETAAAVSNNFFTATATGDLTRIQADLEKAFDKIEPFTFSEPKLLQNVAIKAVGTDTPVFHGLGRPIRGFIVVRTKSSSVVFEGATPTNPSLFVNLQCSGGAAIVVTLLFF